MQLILLSSLIYALIDSALTGVPLQRYESLMRQQSEESGIYNASDKVVKLTESNFNETVLEQNRSSLVEFYNTYCGHCKRFAPTYKQLAEQLYIWREVVIISAIDCAAEENNALCRLYEIMAYPTLRYMGPGFNPNNNFGQTINTQVIDEIRENLASLIAAENHTQNNIYWPNFQPITYNDSAISLFEGLPAQRQYVVVVYEAENSTLGIETALFLQLWPAVEVRRVTDTNLAIAFKIDPTHKISTVDRKGNIQVFNPPVESSKIYAETIEKFLRSKDVTPRPEMTKPKMLPNNSTNEAQHINDEKIKQILVEVHRNKHFVYQADLELAIRTVLFNEIPKAGSISGEKLLALQRFLAVLKRYNPLRQNGRNLIGKLNDFVLEFNQQLTSKDFEDEVKRLETKYAPIFSANHFIGCTGSQPGLRGYTCSLWQLFHFMTVQAARNEEVNDPIEVLQAMHGYIKFFFGCTDCAEHFKAMAVRRNIWNVSNKNEAVLWLWAAHNEVNQRLAGDSTEDPQFPKIQFPSQSSCPLCYKQPIVSPANLEINWNKDAVLSFLNNIHHPEYVSRYGVDEELLSTTLEKLRQKRQIANVLSDMDLRMGMLLYGFCIIMMIIAFKLFAFKGYRRKPYGHDILGKV